MREKPHATEMKLWWRILHISKSGSLFNKRHLWYCQLHIFSESGLSGPVSKSTSHCLSQNPLPEMFNLSTDNHISIFYKSFLQNFWHFEFCKFPTAFHTVEMTFHLQVLYLPEALSVVCCNLCKLRSIEGHSRMFVIPPVMWYLSSCNNNTVGICK